MIVYHGSHVEVSSPDTHHSRPNVDFGKGFYVTPIADQAWRWAKRPSDSSHPSVVSKYDFNESSCDGFKVLRFDSYSDEWLDFVIRCRDLNDDSDYDIVIGNVVNDKVFDTVELYLEGLIGKSEAISRLRFEESNLQIAFRTERSIRKCLRFIGSEEQ